MAKRKFNVTICVDVEIELDDAVINAVDDEWRKSLYDLKTPQDIANHIAYNMIINNWKLSHLDGWADQPDDNAKILMQDYYF
jgi:hypothetical protein